MDFTNVAVPEFVLPCESESIGLIKSNEINRRPSYITTSDGMQNKFQSPEA
jgi:hypothetical protein